MDVNEREIDWNIDKWEKEMSISERVRPSNFSVEWDFVINIDQFSLPRQQKKKWSLLNQKNLFDSSCTW